MEGPRALPAASMASDLKELSGDARGTGEEFNGLGNGLRVWFGLDPLHVRAALEEPLPTPEKARAYRHVLALLCAVRAPTTYLVKNRNALESRVDSYSMLLASAGAK